MKPVNLSTGPKSTTNALTKDAPKGLPEDWNHGLTEGLGKVQVTDPRDRKPEYLD